MAFLPPFESLFPLSDAVCGCQFCRARGDVGGVDAIEVVLGGGGFVEIPVGFLSVRDEGVGDEFAWERVH